jgi:CRISPR-associated protein Csx17
MKIYMTNCKTEPFGSALKALGVMKIIGEQKDPDIESYWENGELRINTILTKEEITNFFMKEYSPTPILAPWLSQSGFWSTFESTHMKSIIESGQTRFDSFRNNVAKIRSIIDKVAQAEGITRSDLQNKKKAEDFRHRNKEKLITMCRNQLEDSYVYWSDAAVVINADGLAKYPPLNGTGGNDARLEFTHTFVEMIANMLLDLDNEHNYNVSSSLLNNSLFGTFTDNLRTNISVGKFIPGLTGGLNQGEGIEIDKAAVNPWDLIFFMEGTTIWTSGIGRKSETRSSMPISPFTVKLSSPYSSADPSDPKSFELWFPVWKNPATLDEIKLVFREGRSDVGRMPASTGLQFAESVNSLGVDRGIEEFVRYSLSVKNGQASFLIPLGQYKVKMEKYPELLLGLDPVLSSIDVFLRKNKADLPPSFKKAREEIEKSVFDFTVNRNKYNAKRVVISLGRFERLLSTHFSIVSKTGLSPLSGLDPKWLKAMDDGSIEMRIALAVSSITYSVRDRDTRNKVGSIRSNIEPVKSFSKPEWSKEDSEFSWSGNSIYEKMANTVLKRLLIAERDNHNNLPLYSKIKLSIYEISEFIHGNFDESLTEDLIFSLFLIKQDNSHFYNYAYDIVERKDLPVIKPFDFALLKLIFLPEDLRIEFDESVHIIPEPAIISLLKSGRVEDACKIAKNRLLSSNLKPINTIFPNLGQSYGMKLAAALLLPVDQRELTELALIKNKGDRK